MIDAASIHIRQALESCQPAACRLASTVKFGSDAMPSVTDRTVMDATNAFPEAVQIAQLSQSATDAAARRHRRCTGATTFSDRCRMELRGSVGMCPVHGCCVDIDWH